jgi:hypothetical protein
MRVLEFEELKVVSGGGGASTQAGGVSASANGALKCEISKVEVKDVSGTIRTEDKLSCNLTVSVGAQAKGAAAPSGAASAPSGGGKSSGGGTSRSSGKGRGLLVIDWDHELGMA